MHVELQNSQEDFNNFFKNYFFKRDLAKRLLLLIILSLAFGNGRENRQPFIITNFIFRTITAALVLSIVFFIAPYLITLLKFKKSIKTKPLTQLQKITLNSDGVGIITENENTFWKWETLNKANIIDEYLFFTLFTNKLYLIPLRFFSSNNDAINFLGVIKNNISKVKGESRLRKIRNLYYWGLVGFVPNFGVIAGVILIIKGFQFNEIKLMLVGVADILFTVFFWAVIFPYLIPK
jgi:hypothetical protein